MTGARQAGKSTLVRQVAKGHDAERRNLDRAATLHSAHTDPTDFVASSRLVIDEIQRAPELLLAIKEQVDTDTRPLPLDRISSGARAAGNASSTPT